MEDLLSKAGEKISRCMLPAKGQPKRLAEPELDLVQLLIKCRPTRTYKGINERKYQGAIHGKSFDFYNRPFCPTAYQKGK